MPYFKVWLHYGYSMATLWVEYGYSLPSPCEHHGNTLPKGNRNCQPKAVEKTNTMKLTFDIWRFVVGVSRQELDIKYFDIKLKKQLNTGLSQKNNKKLRGTKKVVYLCSVNRKIGYPGRIPRGQDYIDTTQKNKSLARGFLLFLPQITFHEHFHVIFTFNEAAWNRQDFVTPHNQHFTSLAVRFKVGLDVFGKLTSIIVS